MTPPGLGFVVANDRARGTRRPAAHVLLGLTDREGDQHYQKCRTPPEHLFGQRQALDMLFEQGLTTSSKTPTPAAWCGAVGIWAEGQATASTSSSRPSVVRHVMGADEPAATIRRCAPSATRNAASSWHRRISGKAVRIAHMGLRHALVLAAERHRGRAPGSAASCTAKGASSGDRLAG
jgi:alanine-glyoxylate transaminase/serine-glyoxylate transaminase/serine-pyruvate transaminase